MKLFIFLSIFWCSLFAHAGDINWSGRYRIEAQDLHNPNLGSDAQTYSYLNHHLILSPEMVAADGIVIHSRFDIFNNTEYTNSQFGEFFGGSDTTAKNRAVTGEVDTGTLAVTDLYLTWNQQYGSLIAGRAPVQFGLGITHNAGNGEFDHWFDRKDLIGYKLVMGNFYFLPMYGKVKEGDPQEDDDIRDYMFQAEYENLDTDLEIGIFYQKRVANGSANDVDTTQPIFNSTLDATKNRLDVKTYNLFVKKRNGPISVAVEGSMQNGDTGLTTAGTPIELGGSAIVAEIGYTPEASKWGYDLKLGTVSGDDPNTAKYEGYLLNRNYDVALILFNYVLGSGTINGSENYIRAVTTKQQVDVGQASNTLYFSPGVHWKWGEKWGMNGRFTYAALNKAQYDGQSKSLGMEADVGIYYNPFERFHIGFDAGYLWAGDAFKGNPSSPTEVSNAYGLMTKAAVSF